MDKISQTDKLKGLRNIGRVFRKEETDYRELVNAIQDYEALVFEASAIDIDNESNRSDIQLAHGKALGTTWAALCIRDIMRTKTFIKGLFNAIDHVKKKKEGPINVLYAGTGPFAALILPIMAAKSVEEVQFTLLEVNKVSFDSANRVINELGFGGYVRAAVNEDATKYVVDPDHHIDIVVSETMQHALKREQQVPIVMNLMRQVKDATILIPEKITLTLCLMNVRKFHARKSNTEEGFCIRLGHFFELSRKKIDTSFLTQHKERAKWSFPQRSFELRPEDINEYNKLAIITDIQVFGEDRIGINESGLTTPVMLEDLSAKHHGLTLTIGYTVDQEPGIEYRWIRN